MRIGLDARFIAFPVATPGPGFAPGPGRLLSRDGLNWTVDEPTTVSFGQVTPTAFEIGGVERMANGRLVREVSIIFSWVVLRRGVIPKARILCGLKLRIDTHTTRLDPRSAS